jgi:hypothetical protein
MVAKLLRIESALNIFVTVAPRHLKLAHLQRLYYQSVHYEIFLHFMPRNNQVLSLLCVYF